MSIERVRDLLRQAREVYSSGKCVTSVVAVQKAISEAMKFAGSIDLPEWARERIDSLCRSSPWLTPICEPEIGPPIPPEEGSCSEIDARGALEAGEEILKILEEVQKKKRG